VFLATGFSQQKQQQEHQQQQQQTEELEICVTGNCS
jgi:hypothetical protein